MNRLDAPAKLVLLAVIMTVANTVTFAACYKGDPGYGLPPLGPGPDGIVETVGSEAGRDR